ncbi:MAG: DNA-3-methyladenine glycosylase family protein [Candidatus Bathyarchaeia archaeon]
MELKLNMHLTPFDLENTLQCGQLFRWEKRGDWWYGVVEEQVFKVQQIESILEFEGVNVDFVKNYFRLDDNLPQIIFEISRDTLIKQAVQTFLGLRIARQSPWECLISYICATYKNIPAIKSMISELSKQFGDEITFENHDFYTFPDPNVLAKATLYKLRKCKLGFRAKRVRETARIVDCNKIDFKALKRMDYETAKGKLLQLPGVGNKVADCILLFSLEKLEAFPVDIWMRRIIQEHYVHHFDPSFINKFREKKSLSPKEYNRISSFARNYFGKHAGYAQEYLFHFARSKQL